MTHHSSLASPSDITDVPGVTVGHWEDPDALTGCTVVRFPHENRAGVETRGAAPGSRETALLEPGMAIRRVDAIVLSGGSAFGLAAIDGVVQGLEAEGRGQPTPAGPVPIVPGAVIFDLAVGDASVRPGPEQGRSAFTSASGSPLPDRFVGAGCGATVAKWRGPDHVVRAGIGSASIRVGRSTVGALVVANAIGDVYGLDGTKHTGGLDGLVPPFWLATAEEPLLHTNTTLVVVATDDPFEGPDIRRLAVRAQDALAATLRPAHSRYDGDTAFAVSLPTGTSAEDPDVIEEAAFHATAAALIAAVTGTQPE